MSLLGGHFVGLDLFVQLLHGSRRKLHKLSKCLDGSGLRSEKICAGRHYRGLLMKFFRHRFKLSKRNPFSGVKFIITQNVHQPFKVIISQKESVGKA